MSEQEFYAKTKSTLSLVLEDVRYLGLPSADEKTVRQMLFEAFVAGAALGGIDLVLNEAAISYLEEGR